MIIEVARLSTFALAVGLAVHLQCKRDYRLFTPWALLCILLTSNVGIFLIPAFVARSETIRFNISDTVIENLAVSCMVCNLLSILFCGILVARTSRRKLRPINSRIPHMRGRLELPLWILSALGLLLYLRSERGTAVLTNFHSIVGDYDDYYRLRQELIFAPPGPVVSHLIELSLNTFLPILTLMYIREVFVKKRGHVRLLAAVSMWMLISLLQLQKEPILIVLITCLFGAIIALKENNYRVKTLIQIGFVGLAGVAAVAATILMALGGVGSVMEGVIYVMDRLVRVPVMTTYAHFYVFPGIESFLHYGGSRTLNVLFAFGQESTGGSAPQIVSYRITGELFNMNTGLIGAGWAEMGLLGVAQQFGITFAVIVLWDLVLDRFALPMVQYYVLAYLVSRVFHLNNGDIVFCLINMGLVIAPFIIVAMFDDSPARRPPHPNGTIWRRSRIRIGSRCA